MNIATTGDLNSSAICQIRRSWLQEKEWGSRNGITQFLCVFTLSFVNTDLCVLTSYLKFLPIATIFLPVVKKVRADMFSYEKKKEIRYGGPAKILKTVFQKCLL